MNYPVALVRDTSFAVLLRSTAAIAAPMTHVAPVGPKGDPGGNIMSIGLFEDAHSLSIPTGTDIVRTAGHTAVGIGPADYFEDLTLGDADVTAFPHTIFKSTNSRYFRLDASGCCDVAKFGVLATTTAQDGTSGLFNGFDLFACYEEAQAYFKRFNVSGGWLHFAQRSAAYRTSARLVHTEAITITGDGHHENPGIVAGVTYVGIEAYPGSVVCFDRNVAGPIFYDITDTGTASEVTADIAAHGSASTYWKFQTARGSVMRDLHFMGGLGTNIAAHGTEVRTPVEFTNVRWQKFAGSGLKMIGSADTGTVPFGIVDGSLIIGCHIEFCLMHGLHVEGRDANVISFLKLRSANNGGCNIFENSFLGNDYPMFDLATGNRSYGTSSPQRTQLLIDCPKLSDQYFGSIYATSIVAAHRFHGYIEGGTGSIGFAAAGIVSGQCADDALWTTDTTALVEDVFGKTVRSARKHLNNLGSKKVGFSFGIDSTLNDVFGWGSLEEDAGGFYRQWRMGAYNADGGGSWHLYPGGSFASSAIQFPGGLSTWHSRGGSNRWGPAFPSGFFRGGHGFGPTMYQGTGVAAPTTGAWLQGDTIWNSSPAASGKIGWVCVTAGTPGTWKAFGAIDA